MNKEEKRKLAEQLEANPLFTFLLDQIENNAIEQMLDANTNKERRDAAYRVHAAREFRTDWQRMLTNNRERKKVA